MVWFFWLEIANLSGLKDFAFAAFYIYNYNERVETPTAPNSNSSSAEAIFDQKIPSHSFQTEQHVRGRFEESSRIVRSKIHPNGPELAFEQKRVTDWTQLNNGRSRFRPVDRWAKSILTSMGSVRVLGLCRTIDITTHASEY